MKKKLLALFASMAIVLSLSALMVFADETKETGEYPVKTEESVTGESIPVEDTDDDFVAEKVTQKTIKVNTDVTDHLENQKDAFVYFFTLDAPGKVQIQFKHEVESLTEDKFNPYKWTVELKKSDGTTYITGGLEGKYSIPGHQMSYYFPSIGLPKGTYCAIVHSYEAPPLQIIPGSSWSNLEYTIRVNYTKSSVWETENNDSFKVADPIKLGSVYYGSSFVMNDADYYKFTLDEPGKVQIHFEHDEVDYSKDCWALTLFGEDGTTGVFGYESSVRFAGNNNGGYSPAIGLKKGTYYLRITSDDSWSSTTYHFSVNYSKSTVWEQEKNGEKEFARAIALNQKYYGSIHGTGDYDWYKFTIPTSDMVTISFNHPQEEDTYLWHLALLASDGSKVIDEWNIKGNSQFKDQRVLKGTFYIRLSCYNPDGSAGLSRSTYNLQVKVVPGIPSSVKAASASTKSIKISWAKVDGAEGYEVWRAESAKGTFARVTTTTANSFTNSSLTSGKKYYYKVRAYKTINGKRVFSDYSSVVEGIATPLAPSKVSAKATSSSTIKVSWTSPAGASIIEVWRTNKANAEQKDYVCIGRYMAKDSSCVSKQLLSGTTYYYKVRAYTILSNGSKVYTSYSSVVSAKTQGETASKGAVDFATRLYTKCLGRQPEADGLNYWSVALTKHEKTGAEAAKLFFQSEEFKNFKTSNKEYVTRLYRTFMGREPETDGLNYWVGELGKGTSRDSVLASFASSQEFTNICKQYGIVRGTI